MRRRLSLLVLSVFALVACKNDAAGGAAPGATQDDSKFYDLTVAPVALGKGATGALRVVITAKEGLHWNDEFPARLSVDAGETPLVRFAKTEVKKGDAEIVVSSAKDRVELSLPIAAKDVGEGSLSAKLNFSLCTDKTCHIFRNRDVVASVTVR